MHDIACWALDHAHGMQPFQILYRWLHILSAMLFVGLTAFFGLLLNCGPRTPGYDIGPKLLRHAFDLWRWAALTLFFCGLNLLHMLYNFPTRNYFGGDKGLGMSVSASVGSILVAFAWFFIWPAQRKHLGSWDSGDPAFSARFLAPEADKGLLILIVLLPGVLLGMELGAHGLALTSTGWGEVIGDFGIGSIPGLVLAAYKYRQSI